MKLTLTTALLLLFSKIISAQVNLQKGTTGVSIPIYSFSDQLSRLSCNINLAYSSGNGLLVDRIPSCVGEGWDINGLGSIVRIQNGEPDDQFERAGTMYDDTKYPAGYLFNPTAINKGCPTLLNTYPLFGEKNTLYKENNITVADRELDYFVFNFNGQNGKFILDKTGKAKVLNDSRLIIEPTILAQPINNCRTAISKFVITDENGLKYEFSQRENTKIYNYYPDAYLIGGITNVAHEIPDNQNPYVTNGWYLTKIEDPLNARSILFEYKVDNIQMDGAADLQLTSATKVNTPTKRVLTSTFTKHTIQKPEILKISLPNNESIVFNYGSSRKDCNGSYKLNEILIKRENIDNNTKFQLEQNYFVKNEIKEPVDIEKKWSRLCLLSVKQSSNNEKLNPYKFEYYTGNNSTEDFVPPIFFHAKDPWGYYNGNYCGVPVDRIMDAYNITESVYPHISNYGMILALYNSPEINDEYPGGFENLYANYIKSNAKSGYAKNGLLKNIFNPYGGKTTYEYVQNKLADKGAGHLFYLADRSVELGVVGGVNVSKITQKESDNSAPVINEYKYINPDNTSSLWGVEFPSNIKEIRQFYQPQGKYFAGLNCKYDYQYPGITHVQSNSPTSSFSNIIKIASTAVKIYSAIKSISKLIDNPSAIAMPNNFLVQLIVGIIESCQTESDFNISFVHHNTILNYANMLPAQFKRVEVSTTSSNNQLNGKTVYEYTSEDDYPVIVPQNYFPYTNKMRAYDWAYGLPKSIKYIDKNSKLIKSSSYVYSGLIENKFTSDNTLSCNCSVNYIQSKRVDQWNGPAEINSFVNTDILGNGGAVEQKLKVEFYNQAAGRIELLKSTDTLFNNNGNKIVSSTDYTYSSKNYLPNSQKSIDSRGKIVETKTYYPEDYTVNNFPVLQNMITKNMVNTPVSIETWQTRPSNTPEMLNASVTEFGTILNGDIKPVKSYSLQTDAPVAQNVIGVFNPAQLIRKPDMILPATQFTYDAKGNLVQTDDLQGKKASTSIYGYDDRFVIATISNATKDETAYTSFEKNAGTAEGNWSYAGINLLTSTTSVTGNKIAQLQNNGITYSKAIAKKSIISLWSSEGNALVNGSAPIRTGPTINGWKYCEYEVNAGVNLVTVSGTCKLDELRLYPKAASMATVTYEPSLGKTSECDINNRIVYYEYDGLGRITKVKDENRNVVKTYEYHFKEQ